jgi:hypothetical protein
LSSKKQKRSAQEQQRRQRQRERDAVSATPPAAHPFALYRTGRLARLFSVRRETIWRWRKEGLLPPFVRVGRCEGLTGEQLQRLLEQRQREAAS